MSAPGEVLDGAAAHAAWARHLGLEDGVSGQRRQVPVEHLGAYLDGYDAAVTHGAWAGVVDLYDHEAEAIETCSETDLEFATLSVAVEVRRAESGMVIASVTGYGRKGERGAVEWIAPVTIPEERDTRLLLVQLRASRGRDDVTAGKIALIRAAEAKERERSVGDGMARAGAGIAEALS